MQTSQRLKFLKLLVSLSVGMLPLQRAYAVRTVVLPPYSNEFTHDFRLRNPPIGANAPIGLRVQAKIRLINMSNVEQNGKLSVALNRFEDTVRLSHSLADFDRIVSLCGDSTATATNSGTFNVKFSLPANQGKTLLVEALFTNGKFCADSLGTKCFLSAGGIFNPEMKLEIEEDRGVIIGTLNYNLNTGGYKEGATETTCSGATYTGGLSGDLPAIITFASIPINGGRPF